jgi:hypothetical protein
MNIQQALQQVGYKVRQRTLRSAAEREAKLQVEYAALEKLGNQVIDPITKPLRIQVQRAGSRYRARYHGDSRSIFLDEPKEAARQLKFFCFGS